MYLVAAAAAVAVATAAIYGLKAVAPVVSLSVVYLPVVLLVSAFWGLRLGLLTGSDPGLTVAQILVAGILGEPRFERGNDLARGGSREPEARGNEHDAGVTFAAGADEVEMQGTEVAQVGGYNSAPLGPRERDDVRIRQRLPLSSLLDRNGVVSPRAQLSRHERREHLVEQQLQCLSACRPASQAARAVSLSRSLSWIHSSISSRYAP